MGAKISYLFDARRKEATFVRSDGKFMFASDGYGSYKVGRGDVQELGVITPSRPACIETLRAGDKIAYLFDGQLKEATFLRYDPGYLVVSGYYCGGAYRVKEKDVMELCLKGP